MKFSIPRQILQEKLSYLNHAVSSKNQLPVLLHFLLEAQEGSITISSTDLEIGIEATMTAQVEEVGSTTLPAKTFTELVQSLAEDTITIQTKDQAVEVSTKKTKSSFQTTSNEEYPKLYEEKGEKIAELDTEIIKHYLNSVIFSASADTTRPALSGVLVRKEDQGFLLVATDGFRLSLKHYKNDDEKSQSVVANIIVPARVFRELVAMKESENIINVYVSQGNNQIIFEQGKTLLIGRLIESEFPPFEKIIPSDFSANVQFDREEMQKAVKICSIFARDAANIIKLSIKQDHIVVSSQAPSLGENTVTVDAKLNGEENEIAFNARYLLDVLANIDANDLEFSMVGPLNPGVFKIKDDESFLHLIMPIRVQS
jgi:DNA polymerase-3 subunit beta